jgi:hypothetical protein
MNKFIFKFKHLLNLNNGYDYLLMQKQGHYQEILNYIDRAQSKGMLQMPETSVEADLSELAYIEHIFMECLDNAFELKQIQCLDDIFKTNKFNSLIDKWFMNMFENGPLKYYNNDNFNIHLTRVVSIKRENVFSAIVNNNNSVNGDKIKMISKILSFSKSISPSLDAVSLESIINLPTNHLESLINSNQSYFLKKPEGIYTYTKTALLMHELISSNKINDDNWLNFKKLNELLKKQLNEECFLPKNANILSYSMYVKNEYLTHKILKENLVNILNEENYPILTHDNNSHYLYQNVETSPQIKEFVLAYYEKEKFSKLNSEKTIISTKPPKKLKI